MRWILFIALFLGNSISGFSQNPYAQNIYSTASGKTIRINAPTPENSTAYLEKSIEFYKNKDVIQALNYADSAIASNLKNAEAYYRSGCYRIDLKDIENAKKDLSEAKDLGYEKAEILLQKLNQPARGTGVYICNTGQKYHSSNGCRGLSRCTHGTSYVSKSDAQSQGYSGCGYCYR